MKKISWSYKTKNGDFFKFAKISHLTDGIVFMNSGSTIILQKQESKKVVKLINDYYKNMEKQAHIINKGAK